MQSSITRHLPQAVVAALRQGEKIKAIKLLREAQDLDLKEAKDLIDQYIQDDPVLQRKFSVLHSDVLRNIFFIILTILLLLYAFYFL